MSPLRAGFIHLVSIALFLVAGLGILSLSLVSVSLRQVELTQVEGVSYKLRFSKEILPGHVLYPFQAARSRIRLFFLSQDHKCQEMLSLSKERLEQATQLGEMGEVDMAAVTAFKGQRYITQALHQCPLADSKTLHPDSIAQLVEAYQKQLKHFETNPKFSQVALMGNIKLDNLSLSQQLPNN